jgi:uncharacterized protein (DUF305 family)
MERMTMLHRGKLMLLSTVLVLSISACGQAATTDQNTSGSSAVTPEANHGGTPMETVAPTPTMETPIEATATAGAAMDHGAMPASAGPFDAQFIDSMIEHHQGAITMAEQALQESQREEIKQLAQNIISSQQREVEQMTSWRSAWYPDLEPTGGMSMSMGDMEVSPDTSIPFEQRFITAMIAHHDGAIAMAKEAQTKAEHPEIKQLAGDIIQAQETEVAQMNQWQSDWFNE